MSEVQLRWRVGGVRLGQIAAHLVPKANAIAAKAALDIQAQAQSRAPVDTGTLRSSIQATQTGEGSWKVVVGVDYGVYVEYGTRFMSAQPYFRPAVTAVRPAFQAALRSLL